MQAPNATSAFVLALLYILFPAIKTDKTRASENVIMSLLFIHIAVSAAKAIAVCPLGTNPSFTSSPLSVFFEQPAFIEITAITTNIIATKARCIGDFTILLNMLSLIAFKFSSLKNIKYPTTKALHAANTTAPAATSFEIFAFG